MSPPGAGGADPGPPPRARRNEVRGAASIASDTVDTVSRPIQATHSAISDTVFGVLRRAGLGPASAPVRFLHDTISAGVYGSVRVIGKVSSTVVGSAAVLARGDDWRPITSTPTGAMVTGAINGFIGDRMVEIDNDLVVPMSLYSCSLDGERGELPGESEEVARVLSDHPDRDLGHVVLFVHGLSETEYAWRIYGEQSAGEGYAESVASHVGSTPLLLRYNTGLRIADNGEALSRLLTAVLADWPVPVHRIDLVGHSMGGLVLRHACHHAVRTGAPWVSAVRRMVYLGAPHRGAPLAHRVEQAAGYLARHVRSRAWSELLDRRSAGIHDLTAGVSDTEVPLLAGASHHAVAACLTASPHHPLAHVLGDLFVPVDSARGAIADVEELPSSHHFHLLNDPDVHAHLWRWLAADEPAPGATTDGPAHPHLSVARTR